MESNRYADKTALITGAASGIGRATARRLAEEGATVYAVDVSASGLAETADGNAQIHLAICDVSDEQSVVGAVSDAIGDLGHLDVLVNLAGVLSFGHTHDVTLNEWNRILSINLTGTFLMCREALPHLIESQGAVVNAASTTAHAGQAWAAAYTASKGAILALTRTLAVEYGRRGVRVNSISPGAIETPIMDAFAFPEGADTTLLYRAMPLGKAGTPADAAAAIAYLASDEAHYLNGSDLRVDGATTA